MSTTPFTLAALATSAVPGLAVTGARPHSAGSSGAFLSAVLSTESGDVIVRVPTTPAAEVQQSAELLAIAALADGARAHLPFSIPSTLGITRARDTRAVVSTYLPGIAALMEEIEGDSDLTQQVAEILDAVHSLPSGIVRSGGLPVRDADAVRSEAERLVQRAADTGMLPSTVRARWNDVLDADAVWSFEPTVVHGALAPEVLLTEQNHVTGVLAWHELSLGDPASDLNWLLLGDPETFESVLARYTVLRGVSGQQELSVRARFYHELEVAKWLLHGFEAHDQEVVDDAVTMLDRLVDRLSLLGAPLPKQRVLSESEVEEMLDHTPHSSLSNRSDSAEDESLDEDRAFLIESDFAERAAELGDKQSPTDAGGSDAGGPYAGRSDSTQTDASEASTSEEIDGPTAASSTGSASDSAEQITQVIEDEVSQAVKRSLKSPRDKS
ncbi:phosphotransferase [Leucobacter sp. UT-8R-CII-1-4]|uniref:phosphotransferase n=1 Tax=Leucobacter sp. UT-8R-CII-1-4 TaxID=3040075 RepID=UPI0024A9BA7D|nr:phosphotransferase [Leucobacter sp. UT-8R-CII-1-4]MDI6023113.1 phosphotransferase [Leucobacter sp. UT-8R-CII-1-4]